MLLEKVDNLNKGSHNKIKVCCDICKKEKLIEYRRYNSIIEKDGFYTCIKCKHVKTEKTNFKKYGVKYPSQNEEIMKKTINKSLSTREKTLKEKYPFILDVDYNTKFVTAHCDICNKNYKIHLYLFHNRNYNKNLLCTLCNPRNESSAGELEIKSILDNKNIKYVRQKKFKGCKNKKPLSFDFYLPDYNICIEYDGRQHFNDRTMFYTEDIEINDDIKTNFCKENDIRLIRIKYNENIEQKLLFLSSI